MNDSKASSASNGAIGSIVDAVGSGRIKPETPDFSPTMTSPQFPGFAGLFPGGIFPQIPRDDLIQRLRERALLNGAAAQAAGMNPFAAWLTSSFPQVDASGVGNLGGSLNPYQEEDGKDEDKTKDISIDDNDDDGKMADLVIDGDENGSSSPNVEPINGKSLSEGGKEEDRSKSGSPENKRSASTGDLEIDVENEDDEPDRKSPKIDFTGIIRPRSGGDLPHLRSAINSPLNSLLYKKKLNTVIKKNKDDNFPMKLELEHLKEEYMGQSGGGPPEITTNEGTSPTMVPRNASSPSDTHSSGSNPHSSPSEMGNLVSFDQTAPGHCFSCQLLKGKLGLSENRNRFLEGKVTSLESKISRLESKIATMDSNTKRYETEGRSLRHQNETLQRKLIDCQEKALGFLQNGGIGDTAKTQKFLSEILQASSC